MLGISDKLGFRELVWGLIAYKPDSKFFSKEELESRISNSNIQNFNKLAKEIHHSPPDGRTKRLEVVLDLLVISRALHEQTGPQMYRMNISSKVAVSDILSREIEPVILNELRDYAKEFWNPEYAKVSA